MIVSVDIYFAALELANTGFMINCLKRPFLIPTTIGKTHDIYDAMKGKQLEEGDCLQVCPIKAGQHWTYEILTMLLNGKAQYTSVLKEESWIDKVPIEDLQEALPRPRVLCTHLALGWLPDGFR